MNLDDRKALLAVLAGLDPLTADAEAILDDPGDVENGARAEELANCWPKLRPSWMP